MSYYTTTDLIQIAPIDYNVRNKQELKEALNNLPNKKQYVILPNPEELKDTREDEAITFTRGWDFRNDPETLVFPNDRILPRLLSELQHLNKNGKGNVISEKQNIQKKMNIQ